jgi:hypothetical protein
MNFKCLAGIGMSLALTGCAVNSPDRDAPAAGKAPARPVEVLLYAEATRPDELGRIVVPVMLSKQGPFHFMLDTGATRTAIAARTVAQLGLQPDQQQRVLLRGVSGVKRVPTVVLQKLEAGSMQFDQLRVPVLSGRVMEGLDGVIGADTLNTHRVSADFRNDRIRISDGSDGRADKRYQVVAFKRISRPLVMIDVLVGPVRARAVIDTGGAHTLGNNALLGALRSRFGGNLPGTVQSRVADATDTLQPALLAPVPYLVFGPVALANLPVSFGDFSIFDIWGINDRPTLLLGMDVLGMLDGMIIDYPRKELHIAKLSPRETRTSTAGIPAIGQIQP